MVLEYTKSKIEKLRRQIEDDRTLNVLDELLSLLSAVSKKKYNETVLQKARYIRIERQERLGLITYDTAQIHKNRINQAILYLLDGLRTELTPQNTPLGPPVPDEESLSPLLEGQPDNILGVNNLRQISWIAKGLAVSRSVCRIHSPQGLGTGFLVGESLLMTNHHVIRSTNQAKQTVIEFGYQLGAKDDYEHTYRYDLDPSRFHTSIFLDYTLVGVRVDSRNPPLDSWGTLSLNPNADPVRGELACIIQHPNGGLKQISMSANWVLGCSEHRIWYTTDTMKGSSGSPVFNDVWQVVAIHHAGGIKMPKSKNDKLERFANEGILMSHIKPNAEAAGLWPGD